jgi:hypothetical protein
MKEAKFCTLDGYEILLEPLSFGICIFYKSKDENYSFGFLPGSITTITVLPVGSKPESVAR